MKNKVLALCGTDTLSQSGLAADLRTFFHYKITPAFVITAHTIQNADGVISVIARRQKEFEDELRFVFEHFRPGTIKIGMVPTEKIIHSISSALRSLKKLNVVNVINIILDPIYEASSGGKLITDKGYESMKKLLLPGAIVTPNIPEAERLCGCVILSLDDRQKAARHILALGARAVIIKGGHSQDDASDLIMTDKNMHILRAKAIMDEKGRRSSLRGSGCSFSAALAAELARGKDLVSAARSAKRHVRGLMRARTY